MASTGRLASDVWHSVQGGDLDSLGVAGAAGADGLVGWPLHVPLRIPHAGLGNSRLPLVRQLQSPKAPACTTIMHEGTTCHCDQNDMRRQEIKSLAMVWGSSYNW